MTTTVDTYVYKYGAVQVYTIEVHQEKGLFVEVASRFTTCYILNWGTNFLTSFISPFISYAHFEVIQQKNDASTSK